MFKYFTFISLLIALLTGCSTTSPVFLASSQPSVASQAKSKIDASALLSDFETLSSEAFAGRKYGTEGNLEAQQFIANELANSDISAFKGEFLHAFEYKRGLTTYAGTNVIGFKAGETDKVIVLTAHFDHLGMRGSKIYYGADDNASGTAALLNIAKALQTMQTRHSVIYLFTDAEEENLVGANAFAQDFEGELANIILNLNMDMLAGAQYTKRLYYLPYKVDDLGVDDWQSELGYYAKTHDISIRKGPRAYHSFKGQKKKTNWRKASDHGVFYRYKIPFLYFGVGVHQNYHTPEDTFENTNHSFYIGTVHTIFDQLYNLDQQIQ